MYLLCIRFNVISAMIVTCKQTSKEGRKKAFNPNSLWYLGRQPYVVEPEGACLSVVALKFSSVTC